jgi:DNA repair exonuclease SbcCD ATPase subunit
MIELQKAKFSSDIMRFRRYLGLHYQNPDNTYGSDDHKKARQIYGIFLLGYDIGIRDCPIIQVDPNIKDGTTKKNLKVTNEFIESLHHRSWIIQLEQLKQHRRNDAEKLLSIFDSGNRTAAHHILQVDENEFPKRYNSIIRRLRMASESADVQTEMEMEDDFMKELQDKERDIAEKDKALEEDKKVIKEKDKALEEKDKTIKEKDKTIEEDKKALEEKDKALEEKDKTIEEDKKALEEKDKLIKELKEQLAKSQI